MPTPETRDAARKRAIGACRINARCNACLRSIVGCMPDSTCGERKDCALLQLATPPAGPTVWVARELHELWQKNGWQPEPGTQLVADITLTVTPKDDRPRETVPYQLVPAAEASDA